eukprot:GHVR01133431.1.p1 GENE.GHVR01133431.1~~GHVR01133431.1.p1  ORF type:complete len:319 (+),score=60.39 GHVR01133431.1:53-1009(+)
MRRSTRRRSTFADKASNKASNWLSLISSSLNEAYDSVSQTLSQCGGDRQRGSMQGSDNQDDILSNLLFGSKLAAVSEGSYEDDNTDTCSSSSNPRTTGTNNNKKDEISTKSRADSISSASEVSHTQHHPTRGGNNRRRSRRPSDNSERQQREERRHERHATGTHTRGGNITTEGRRRRPSPGEPACTSGDMQINDGKVEPPAVMCLADILEKPKFGFGKVDQNSASVIWITRWFEVDFNEAALIYYKNRETAYEEKPPSGKMPLCCISSVEPIGAREFLVRANDSQTSSVLLLRAPDSACRDKWTRSLVELANQESGI